MNAYRENARPALCTVTWRKQGFTGDPKQPCYYVTRTNTFATREEAAAFALGLREITHWDADPRVE